jgi:integrase
MPIVLNALREAKLKGQGAHVFANGAGNVENHSNLVQRVLQQVQVKPGVAVPDLDAEGKPKRDKNDKPVMKAKYGGLHSLRHYFAAWWLTRSDDGGLGLTLKELQERLGHATMAMTTDTYGHLLPPRDEKERQRMAEAHKAMFG